MLETQEDSGNQTDAPPECTFAEFFESKPANVIFRIADATPKIVNRVPSGVPMIVPKTEAFRVPPIHLWCSSDECDGVRIFDPDGNDDTLHLSETDEKPRDAFVSFSCRNCRRRRKQYAILYSYGGDRKRIDAIKVGEHPPLSQQIPSRLRKLVGADQEKFNKGLRSEAHGLGVGAFAYYRQVVENQKDRLISEIIKVSNLQNPSPELVAELEEAKRQNQFSTAVEKIKHAIPEVLLIQGHNPLILLHKALSEGLHAGTDAECLQIAQDIHVVLSEFSERLAAALKEDRELKRAVSGILNRQKSK